MTQVIIDHCIKCACELQDPPREPNGTGFFRLNDNRKICEYCDMRNFVNGYYYDRDGNLHKQEEDLGVLPLWLYVAIGLVFYILLVYS